MHRARRGCCASTSSPAGSPRAGDLFAVSQDDLDLADALEDFEPEFLDDWIRDLRTGKPAWNAPRRQTPPPPPPPPLVRTFVPTAEIDDGAFVEAYLDFVMGDETHAVYLPEGVNPKDSPINAAAA